MRPAETSADKYHGVVKFDVATGAQAKSKGGAPQYTKVFGESLIKEARKDDRIVAITAAMPSGTGVDLFEKEFPKRTFDVGIAEQHAVTFAGGLATEGFKPFCAIYSTFLQRAYDQVVHDIAIQKLPVRFALDRAGLVGADGPTHAGAFDVAYLGCLPNFVLMAAADEADLVHMVATQVAIDDRPSALRYPRGEGRGVPMPEEGIPLEIGKGRILREKFPSSRLQSFASANLRKSSKQYSECSAMPWLFQILGCTYIIDTLIFPRLNLHNPLSAYRPRAALLNIIFEGLIISTNKLTWFESICP